MLRVAVIGTGNVAVQNYLPFLKSRKDVELGLYGRNPERVLDITAEFAVRPFRTLKELAEWNPSSALILTSETAHYEVAMALIRAGVKRIFCEKPLVAANGQAHVSEADFYAGRELLMFAQENGCELAMNFNYRFFDQTLLAKETAQSRCFGKVIGVAGIVHYACWSHSIDLLHFFAGRCMEITGLSGAPERTGQGIVACDRAVAFRMESGAVGTLVGSAGLTWQHPLFEMIFTFENGRIHMRDIDGDLEILDGSGHVHERISRSRDASRWSSYGSSFEKSISAYLTSLESGSEPPVSGLAGLWELQFEAALGRSVNERRPIQVQDEFPVNLE